MRKAHIAWGLAIFLVGLPGCGGDGESSSGGGIVNDWVVLGDPWPDDMDTVYSTVLVDPVGDYVNIPSWAGGTGYVDPVPYGPVDVTGVRMGTAGGYVYFRFDFAFAIPTGTFLYPASGEIEEQHVKNQGVNISVDSDNDISTGGGGEGVDGIDIFFAVKFDYGVETSVYSNFGFPLGDLHFPLGQAYGEMGEGGPGETFVEIRFKISELGGYFSAAGAYPFGGWNEAESINPDGSLKYHHFALDESPNGTWVVP